MAGGTFKLSSPKVRPGTYINLKNGRAPRANVASEGVSVIPLIGYDWGPRETWIRISSESPDTERAKLGRSVYDTDNSNMLMLSLLLMGATTVYVYIPDGGKEASGSASIDSGTLELKAKYKGTLGNKLKVVSVANPLGGFDVSINLGAEEVEKFSGVVNISDLEGVSDYIVFAGTGKMVAFASVSLTGGMDEANGNASISKFLDMSEKIRFNVMCFPTEDSSLHAALLSKITYIREMIGWKCQAVTAKFNADYEGIINLTNSFVYDEKELTVSEATAWVAGAAAGADYTTSLTYTAVPDATKVVGEKTNEKSIEAIKAGEMFFSVSENEDVILEYDINSRVTFTEETPPDVNKGRVCRVYDSLCNDFLMTFVPGRFDNASAGWDVMEGLGRAILSQYEADGAITNYDAENDFLVDRGMSLGDSTYFNFGVQAVDSAEKYYFSGVAK